MSGSVRYSVEPGLKIMLKDLGLNISEILKKAGVQEDLFSLNNPSITAQDYINLWSAIEENVEVEDLSLHIGMNIPIESFHPALFAALCSPNLTTCIQRLSQFKRLVGPCLLEVRALSDTTEFEVKSIDPRHALPDTFCLSELVFLTVLGRKGTREEIHPISVITTCEKLSSAYEEFFGCQVKLGKKNLLSFKTTDAELPFVTENESMWNFFAPELRQRLADLETNASYANKVRTALMEVLPSGIHGIDEVSRKLGLSKRSLQRRLNSEETSFQKELNHTRESLARHYIQNSDISYQEISYLIGFEDPNSFFRAFHIWTGKTPDQFKSQLN